MHHLLINLHMFWFSDKHNKCFENEFQCHESKRCISSDLVCDYFDDCADGSDDCDMATGTIVGRYSCVTKDTVCSIT